MSIQSRLRERLRSVTDPELDDDIVTLGLVTEISVDDDVATVSLAFNAPLSPAEWQMCDEIRALCRGMGLEPRLYADAHDGRGVFTGVKNTVAIATPEPPAGTLVVTAHLAGALARAGARVGVLDLGVGLDRSHETWLDALDPPDLSSDSIVPPSSDPFRRCPSAPGFRTRSVPRWPTPSWNWPCPSCSTASSGVRSITSS